jgi:transcriptional regulator with XRE-family HTH domain
MMLVMAANDKRVETKGSKALVKFMKAKEITLEAASVVLGCSIQNVWDICKGVHRPGVRVALRVERWTGIPCEDFATPEERRALAKLKPHSSIAA